MTLPVPTVRSRTAALAIALSMSSACALGTEPATDDLQLSTDEAALASYADSIQNQGSLKCINKSGTTSVNLATCSGNAAQRFEMVAGSYGAVRLRHVGSGLCVVPTGYQGYSTQTMASVLASCSLPDANWDKEAPVAITSGERTGFRWRYDSAFCLEAYNGTTLRSRNGACYPLGNAQKFDVRLVDPTPPPPPPTTCGSGQHCCDFDQTGCTLCLSNNVSCP